MNAISSTEGCCRLCGSTLSRTVVDLGLSPLANALVTRENLQRGEVFLPLVVKVCDDCFLVQLEKSETPATLFCDYKYFSSYATSWLRHAEAYAAAMIGRFDLDPTQTVVEIASNDGYLLQYFTARGIPVLGIEPAGNVADIAISRGIPTRRAFFGAQVAQALRAEGITAALMPANNVLAHVPDLADFLEGFRILLAPEGVATFEFPHLLRLMQEAQFDTIYHEHIFYLCLGVVSAALQRCGLRVFDVEQLATHGGSLRVFACHTAASHRETEAVSRILGEERAFGLFGPEGYAGFQSTVAQIKCDALDFLIAARRNGQKVCGYGAAAKGATFLNYCGIGPELLHAVADASPHKQGHWLPGCRIPIVSPWELLDLRPDYVLILPWNLKDEIAAQLEPIRAWGGKLVTAIPQLSIF